MTKPENAILKSLFKTLQMQQPLSQSAGSLDWATKVM